MKLIFTNIKEATNKVLSDDCTIGQAFNMIDSWCHDNNAWYDIENMWLDTSGPGTRAKLNINA